MTRFRLKVWPRQANQCIKRVRIFQALQTGGSKSNGNPAGHDLVDTPEIEIDVA